MNTENLIHIEGTLAERPRAQMQPLGVAQGPLPVLQLVLHDCGPLGRRVTATQVFPAGAIAAAHARAAQLHPGMRVSVQAPMSLIQLHLPKVQHVKVIKPTPQEPAHA